MAKFKVWIDQDLCTGDGLCAEICPSIFYMHDDGLAYVKESDEPESNPPKHKMSDMVNVPQDLLDAAVESAEECPGECIFIESED